MFERIVLGIEKVARSFGMREIEECLKLRDFSVLRLSNRLRFQFESGTFEEVSALEPLH